MRTSRDERRKTHQSRTPDRRANLHKHIDDRARLLPVQCDVWYGARLATFSMQSFSDVSDEPLGGARSVASGRTGAARFRAVCNALSKAQPTSLRFSACGSSVPFFQQGVQGSMCGICGRCRPLSPPRPRGPGSGRSNRSHFAMISGADLSHFTVTGPLAIWLATCGIRRHSHLIHHTQMQS